MSSESPAGPAAQALLVPLHGFFGSSQDWTGLRDALTPRDIPAQVSWWAPDLPGHGNTPLGVAELSLPGWARWVGAQIEETLDRQPNSGKVVLSGYSMGGRVALELALSRPSWLAGLVLISASPGLDEPQERQSRARLDSERAAAIRQDFRGFLEDWYGMPLFGLQGDALEEAVALRLQNDPATMAQVIETLSPGRQPSNWARLQELCLPTLFLAGSRDLRYLALGERVAAAVGGDFAPVEGASHDPLRSAAPLLGAKIGQWLANHS